MSGTRLSSVRKNIEDVVGDVELDVVDTNVDGRTLRRTRNRTAVIVALLDLIREGNLDPSTSDIADRAGVSDRSIFRYFEDLDDLVRTTIAYAFEEAAVVGAIDDVGQGPLDERVTRFVDARIRVFQQMDGAMRVARMRSHTIPSIDDEFAAILEFTRHIVRRHFADEVEAMPQPHQDDIVDAVVVLVTYDTYAIHTRMLRNPDQRMHRALEAAITTLLTAPAPTT